MCKSYHRACKEGWMEGVKFMLSEIEEIPPPNQVTNETPLHAACEGNHYEIVVELITKFPELLLVRDAISHRRWHPIHTACTFGVSDEILETLLVGTLCLLMERHKRLTGTLTNNEDFFDVMLHTPLYIAIKCQNLTHVRLMMAPFLYNSLKHSAPTLYTVPSDKPSAIHCAISNKQELFPNLLEILQLNRIVYPSAFSIRHMLHHMHRDTDDKPKLYPLLETTICESSDGKLYLNDTNSAFKDYGALSNLELSPLAMAVAMGNVNFTEKLLNIGVNDDNGLALRLALFLQYYDIAKLMLSYDDSNICSVIAKSLSAFELPSNIMNSFTKIHLQENNLSSVPLTLFQLPKLTILDVSNNKLTKLPVSDSLFQSGWFCTDIEIISISNNQLESLPSVIWEMPKLKQLCAGHNSISKIETTKIPCAKIAIVDVSHNQLTNFNIPQNIFLAEDVDISYNKLEYLPDSIWKSKNLTNLNAANNKIKEVGFPMNSCNFKEAFVQSGFNQSRSIDEPCSVYASALSKLNLSSNNLTGFPTHLTCFVYYLQNLDISNNKIPILHICLLPPYIKYLCAAECGLEDIKISCDQDSLCSHKKHTNLKNLSFLNLKGNKLHHFILRHGTDSTKGLIYPELEWLNLSNNQLCELDANIGEQKHLITLNLSNNHNLKSLPLELSNLINTLSILEIESLPNLTDLHLREYRTTRQMLSYMKSKMKRYSWIDYNILYYVYCCITV